MRILVLSHYFWPEPIPKPLELAEALHSDGNTVHIVTGFPNYPDGKLYEGFRLRPFRRETIAGMRVVRAFMYPSHGTSRAGRILNYASFMVTSIAAGILARSFDVIYVWHPPLSIGVAAAAIGFIRRRPFVYDVQDIWPESAIATGFLRPGTLVNLLARLEKFVYKRAAHLFVVTEEARDNLERKGVPAAKITVAAHWYNDADIRGTPLADRDVVRQREGWNDRFVVIFAGNMGVLQGLDTVLHACRQLPEESSIVVAMVGDGIDVPRLKQLAREFGLEDRVRFIPRQTAGEIARYFAAADALLVHLRASPLDAFTIPTKTIAYLAAGKPIVMASTGTAADVVAGADAGIVLPPDDPARLAETLIALARMDADERARMGRSGRQYFEAHFRKEAILPAYIAALRRVATVSRGS